MADSAEEERPAHQETRRRLRDGRSCCLRDPSRAGSAHLTLRFFRSQGLTVFLMVRPVTGFIRRPGAVWVAEGDSEGAIITSGGGLAVAVISRNQVRVRDLVIGVASDVRIVQGGGWQRGRRGWRSGRTAEAMVGP
jgi:hypothetical protein